MYAIGCKFPDQKKFETMNIKTGEQVNSWMYCILFKDEERATEVLEQLKQVVKPEVELKVLKLYNS